MIDLTAVRSTRLATDPFGWAFTAAALRSADAGALRSSFPREGFWRVHSRGQERVMDFRVRPLLPLGHDRPVLDASLDPPWRVFADALLDPAYRSGVEAVTGLSLEDAPLEVSIWRWGVDAQLGPHVDIPRKRVTQVFYFNDEWDPRWGGCLRILRSDDVGDVVEELPPSLGSASLIVRSERSWHAVPAVRPEAPTERLSVVATWQMPGSESAFWTVEADGAVRCHTPINEWVS